MLTKNRLTSTLLVFMLVVAITAAWTVPVLADDEAPPAPIDTAAEAEAPSDSGAIQAAPTGPAAGETTPPDPLRQLPDGTDVIVTHDSGEAVPLASQEAAQIIATADPIWCPTGKAPIALTGGCSNTFANLGALVTGFIPTGSGVIWIQSGADGSAGNILMNGGGSWSPAANFSLTLTGGWNGVSGSKTITGTSTFSRSIAVIGWNAPVTMSDIWVLGATTSAGGSHNSAIDIETTGNIKIDRVDALANSGTLDGATFDNTASIHSATVAVSASAYGANAASGLIVLTDGAVTLTGVNAATNSTGYGVHVDNAYDSTASPVTITDGVYASNGFRGLGISSNGTVTLKNLESTGNAGFGVSVDNTLDLSTSSVTVLSTSVSPNRFNGNGSNGLLIVSHGSVTLKNIAADGNTSDGVNIDNASLATTPKAVTISGLSEFKSNGGMGLVVSSIGVVMLSNLNAVDNGVWGVYVDNTAPGTATPAVNITGNNNFSSNSSTGLFVTSDGAIKINSTSANENGGHGVYLANNTAPSPQNISITGSLSAIHNGDRGLYILSHGTIVAANLTLSENNTEGAHLENLGAPSPKSVTITGFNTFNNNGSEGLQILSPGAITLSNVIALANGNITSDPGVNLFNQNVTTQPGVTLKGYGVFNDNALNGLVIQSCGVVTLSNITANRNGHLLNDSSGSGAIIFNGGGTMVKAVTLKGSNSFNQNDGYGIQLNSDGALTLYNITADSNGLAGAQLDNIHPSVQSKVVISGYGSFESNLSDGLDVSSNGSISASNLNASYNIGDGVNIDTAGIGGPQAVTLNGTNNFTHNGSSGLWVDADGNIKVSNINASYNQVFGARLDNYTNWLTSGFASYGSVTQTGFGNFIDNATDDGLRIWTNGSATIAHVTADFNGNGLIDDGIHIAANHNATILCSSASGNFDNGLFVQIPGNFTIKGFYGYGNPDDEDFAYGSLVRTGCP